MHIELGYDVRSKADTSHLSLTNYIEISNKLKQKQLEKVVILLY